jgi:hypothetical protein
MYDVAFHFFAEYMTKMLSWTYLLQCQFVSPFNDFIVCWYRFMVLNTTFNDISVISW